NIVDRLNALLALFVQAMMASMFAGAVVYYWSPSNTSLLVAVLINMIVMITFFIPILGALVKSAGNPKNTVGLGGRAWFISLVITLTLLNEFLMGWTFNILSGVPKPQPTPPSTLDYFDQIVSSYWFIFPMALEMMLTSLMLRSKISGDTLFLVAMQSAIMLSSPTVFPSHAWGFLASFVGGALMNTLFGWFYWNAYSKGGLKPSVAAYIMRLTLIYTAMMAGLYIWSVGWGTALFALSVVLEMVLYFDAVLGRLYRPEEKHGVGWSCWVATTYAANTLSMVFMGGLIALTGLTPPTDRGELIFPTIGLYAITVMVTIILVTLGLLYTLSTLSEPLRLRLRNYAHFPERLLPFAAAFGLALLPAADLTIIDELGDANPPFHMLEHLIIATGGFIAGIALSRIAQIWKGSQLQSVYVWYTKYSLGGLASVAVGAPLLAFWFSPQMFTLIYQNELIHGAMHITILALGFLAGASFKTLARGLKVFLLATFTRMAPMMAPFSFILAAHAYGNPSYFVPPMSAAMEVYAAGVFAIIALYVHQERRKSRTQTATNTSTESRKEAGA
ncbi:MAG: DUF1404 family protein, partial [Thermoprotei archaeon]